MNQDLGAGLASRITQIVMENNITPAKALEDLKTLVNEVNSFHDSISRLLEIFEILNIPTDSLEIGEAELAISYPGDFTKSNLEGLQVEMHKLDRALRTLGEVAGEDTGSLRLRAIGSSEYQLYLESAPALAAIVATAIERIVALYKKVLEIRKLRLEIARLETPEKVWKPFEDHEKAFEEKEINEIAKRLVGECYEGKDKGRKNELVVGVASALAYLATRIDHGVTVEVRTPNPEEPEKPEAAADSDPEHERLMQSYEEQKRFAEV